MAYCLEDKTILEAFMYVYRKKNKPKTMIFPFILLRNFGVGFILNPPFLVVYRQKRILGFNLEGIDMVTLFTSHDCSTRDLLLLFVRV